jgi:hypothetical protein
MKYSLRKTPSHLHLAYKYGEGGDGLMGRNFVLHVDGRTMTLAIDIEPNFHTRNKNAGPYLDAVHLTHNHHKLKYLQISDNLVRARLIKNWEQVEQPKMRMCLDMGARGRFVYEVIPHSLFMGGIQLDVQAVIEDDEGLAAGHGHAGPDTPHHHRNHA